MRREIEFGGSFPEREAYQDILGVSIKELDELHVRAGASHAVYESSIMPHRDTQLWGFPKIQIGKAWEAKSALFLESYYLLLVNFIHHLRLKESGSLHILNLGQKIKNLIEAEHPRYQAAAKECNWQPLKKKWLDLATRPSKPYIRYLPKHYGDRLRYEEALKKYKNREERYDLKRTLEIVSLIPNQGLLSELPHLQRPNFDFLFPDRVNFKSLLGFYSPQLAARSLIQ